MSEVAKEKVPFDFETHRKNAVDQYTKKRPLYEELGWKIENILTEAIETRGLKSKINAIQSRAKEVPSFDKKAVTPNEQDSEEPKYKNPLSDIADLTGVRVITFFPSTVTEVCQLIQENSRSSKRWTIPTIPFAQNDLAISQGGKRRRNR